MIILEDTSDAKFQIRAYEPGKITINETIYTKSLIVTANTLIDDWRPQMLSELSLEDLNLVTKLKPEIVILGTGLHFKKLPSPLINFFNSHHIGLECMDTHAACRTYTALIAEGRNVLAALLIE